MAEMATVSTNVTVTDGGVSTIGRSYEMADFEVRGALESRVVLAAADSRFIAAEGVDLTGKTGPIVPGYTKVGVFNFMADGDIDVEIDGSTSPFTVLSGMPFLISGAFDSIEITNNSGIPVVVNYILAGVMS